MEMGSRVLEVQARLMEKLPDAYPGMFAAASIKVSEKEAFSLPNSAIIEEGENEHYLFILLEEKENNYTFQRIPVETGIQTDTYTEIITTEGLTEDTEIVVSGVYYLKSELLKELD
jgi:cobalt-zinc-cadmium efflux system membrane fusion protein